jgi:phosphatidylglycerol:prolipoprotein diacylglycerol transferase
MTNAYPLKFMIGSFAVTGFGLMMMLAFLTAAWIADQEGRRLGFKADYAGDIVMGAVIGGIIGAKLWYVALFGADALFSRGGLVWYGGFVGGTLGVIFMGWWRKVPIRWTMHLVAPALAAGYAVGRVGCYVVGDDYGRPTSLPWAVAFPDGEPASRAATLATQFGVTLPPGTAPDAILAVHPTQLYEVTLMLIAFALLWRWRLSPRGTGWLFGAYLVFAGFERFIVEILRAKDDRIFGVFTIAQLTSIVLIVSGSAVIATLSKKGTIAPGIWLEKGSQNT